MRLIFINALLVLSCVVSISAKHIDVTVAVVVDADSYSKIKGDIDAYMAAINRCDGKRTTLIIDRWGHPDSVRMALKKLYDSQSLEGAVLIGDIPVAMIRDAQHLTSAFKMDQTRDRKESSIPSDRFYDDFDLQFNYQGQDSDSLLYHYYSLCHDSPQTLESDIYSARIKAPVVPGKDKYELIAEYLRKAVAAKQNRREISNVLYFAGHGYNSESLNARVDEAWALRRQFPFVGTRKGSRLDFINFDEDDFVKFRLMAKLADPELDVALLHHHGSDDTQYLNGQPATSNTTQYIEAAKRFFRSKMRSSRDTVASKKYYLENYDIPASWLEGAFDAQTEYDDSLYSASMDIHIPDTYGRVFNARFIMIDACFTGSFQLNDYISAHYIFNQGNTMAVRANSVNTLQDIWADRYVGLLNEGVCVGNWVKHTFYLETHLLGDPTFSFKAEKPSDLDYNIVVRRNNPQYWKKLFAKSGRSDIKALALLYQAKTISDEKLLALQENDADPIVRLAAFSLLKERGTDAQTRAIKAAMTDSYELLQRLGVLYAAKSGDSSLLPTLVKLYLDPATSVRVMFHVRTAFNLYPYETVERELNLARALNPFWTPDKEFAVFLTNLKRSYDSDRDDFGKLSVDTVTYKEKKFTITGQRNKCQILYLDKFLDYLANGDSPALRLMTAEALGWYVYSAEREKIIDFCAKQIETEKDESVRNELEKTVRRLKH